MKFAKKVAVITGGSRGIGYQIATRLADEGANVIILSRRGRLENESGSNLVIERGRCSKK
jgi:fengycin family lipopeptide synthetase B